MVFFYYQLKNNSNIIFLGPLKPKEVCDVILDSHLLFSPTTGENFGHAIFEAFALGRPVLISDQTPWINLIDIGVGYDLPLDNNLIIKQKIDSNNIWQVFII